MAIKFPLSGFFQSSGNAAAVFGEQLRDGVAGFACSLWSQYPSWVTESSAPVRSFARGFMNQMCSPIQPPVPAPTVQFSNGQCPGTIYRVDAQWGPPPGLVIQTQVFGPIQKIWGYQETLGPGNNPNTEDNLYTVEIDAFDNMGNPFKYVSTRDLEQGTGSLANYNGSTIVVLAGPDNCGDPEPAYQSPAPTSVDLSTTINITNLDGIDNQYEIVYNTVNNQYNFPMAFLVNGVNVVLDVGGLTIYGDPNNTTPNSGNDSEPPGSTPGNDGRGGTNDTTYFGDYPTLPDFTTPETISEIIEYVLCQEGVITTINETLKIISGNIPLVNVIIDILTNLVEEICEMDTDGEAIVGLPEWYGVRPGTERPAIVYLWKEFINGVWQKPTYSSTVSNPSSTAVDDIATLISFDKTMGTWIASLTLTDGSRIRTSGDTEVVALNNFNFLLNQVDSAFIPPNVSQRIILSENQRLQVKTVKLRQIEYYPDGKAAGVSPSIRRVLDP